MSVDAVPGALNLAADQQAALLVASLPMVADELESGVAVSIARGRLRVRPVAFHHG